MMTVNMDRSLCRIVHLNVKMSYVTTLTDLVFAELKTKVLLTVLKVSHFSNLKKTLMKHWTRHKLKKNSKCLAKNLAMAFLIKKKQTVEHNCFP